MSFSMPSTGDAERDRLDMEAFVASDRKIAEAMCPNGCGGMMRADDEGAAGECPVCGFAHEVFGKARPYAGLPMIGEG